MDQDTGKVKIINIALSRIGDAPIISLDESKPQARKAVAFFNNTRRSMLRKHPWNFAIHEVELARLPSAPTYEFQYAFELPADFLRLVKIHDTTRHKVQGRNVLSDNKVCKLVYVRDVEDPSLWDVSFQDAFAYQMAADMTFGSAGHASLFEMNNIMARNAIREARHIDATEEVQDPMGGGYSDVYSVRF